MCSKIQILRPNYGYYAKSVLDYKSVHPREITGVALLSPSQPSPEPRNTFVQNHNPSKFKKKSLFIQIKEGEGKREEIHHPMCPGGATGT